MKQMNSLPLSSPYGDDFLCGQNEASKSCHLHNEVSETKTKGHNTHIEDTVLVGKGKNAQRMDF